MFGLMLGAVARYSVQQGHTVHLLSKRVWVRISIEKVLGATSRRQGPSRRNQREQNESCSRAGTKACRKKMRREKMNDRKTATISIDDFYLTAAGQAKLREENPGNALLEFRGNSGSHDLSLSIKTLTAMSKLSKEGMKMKLPRDDKSVFSGRGDRADPSTWPEVEGPLTALLFEGWMLGFRLLPMEVVKAVDPQLETVNKNLEAYYDAWDKFIKAWIVIKIKDPSYVYQWRLQAEIAMREEGNPGMSDEEVKDFVLRYLPAYNAYLPTLYSDGPNGSDPERLLVIEIDEGRNPF